MLKTQIEVSGKNVEQYRGVESLAYVDDATGLYNTRYLNNILDREIAQAEATQRSFALRAKTTDIAPQDKQEAALQEFRSQMQSAYATTPEKSLWRDTAKEVRMILELRLGLAHKA